MSSWNTRRTAIILTSALGASQALAGCPGIQIVFPGVGGPLAALQGSPSAPPRSSPTLDPVCGLSITGVDRTIGRVGDRITITGSQLGTGSIPVNVTFAGIPAVSVARKEGALEVVVPEGGRTGELAVTVDGACSTGAGTFWVVDSFAIAAPRLDWDTSATASRLVPYGSQLQFTASVSFSLAPGDDLDRFGTPPAITWVSSDPSAGTLDAQGLLTAGRANKSTSVKARMGSLESSSVDVTAVGVDAVVVSPATLSLNAWPEEGDPEAAFATEATLRAEVQTSLPFDNGVSWTTSDPSLVTVDAAGTVRTARGARKGVALVTAVASDDSAVSATATVSVTILGNVRVEVE